jgi:large repetitive protein
MMKKRIVVLGIVLLLTGCISHPNPWVPKGDVADAGIDIAMADKQGEIVSEDVNQKADVIDVFGDITGVDGGDVLDPKDQVIPEEIVEEVLDTTDISETDVCVPDCEGKQCGDDGCGGSCGSCETGQFCIDGDCPPEGKQCDDGNEVDWDGCTGGKVTEFQVNKFSNDDQAVPAVATNSDGSFIVVWESNGEDGEDWGVFGRYFEPNGIAENCFQVNNPTTGHQMSPSISMLKGGGWIVVWYGQEKSGSSNDIYGRRISSDGSNEGDEFQVNGLFTEGFQGGPDVSALPNGGFTVVWFSLEVDGENFDIVGRRFFTDGTPDGDEFIVNTTILGEQKTPHIASSDAGRSLVVWNSMEQDGDGNGVFGQFIDEYGEKDGKEFQVNPFTNGNQSGGVPVAVSSLDYVVVWNGASEEDPNSSNVTMRFFDANGNPFDETLQVNEYAENVQGWNSSAQLESGGFVVVWRSNKQDGDGYGIFGRRLLTDGNPENNEFQINEYTLDNQDAPRVATFPDDSYIVVWQSDGQDGDGYGIFAQRFDKDGNRLYH